MIKNLFNVLVLAASMTLSGLSLAGLDRAIEVVIEEPAAGESYSGITNLRGWVVSPAGTGRYYANVYIDGEFAFYMPLGGKRVDVANAYPNYPDSDQSGFSMAFNYKSLSPGTHEIKIRAFDNDDNYNDAVVSFNTEKFKSEFIADDSQVDLSTTENVYLVDNHSYLMKGVTVEGKRWDFVLSWDRASQSFKTEQIRTSSAQGGSGGSSNSGSSGSNQPPANDEVYACVTSPSTFYSSSDSMIVMKNGLELTNNSGDSWSSGDQHTVFKSQTGDWYTIKEDEELLRIEVTKEPNSCFEYEYGLVTDVIPNYGDVNLVIDDQGEIRVSGSCPIDTGSKLGAYGSNWTGRAWVVDLLTVDTCEIKEIIEY